MTDPLTARRALLSLAVLAAALASGPTAAQSIYLAPPDSCEFSGCAYGGRCFLDPVEVSADEALARLEAGESAPYRPRDLAARVALSSDSTYRAPLLAYADRIAAEERARRSPRVYNVYVVLSAARRLGVPRSAFRDLAFAFEDQDVLASAAAWVLSEDPDPVEYEALAAAVGDPFDHGAMFDGLGWYAGAVGWSQRYGEIESEQESARFVLGLAITGWPWAQTELQLRAEQDPALIDAVIALYGTDFPDKPGVPPPPPDDVCYQSGEELIERARETARRVVAAPPTLVPPPFDDSPPDDPPVNDRADVRPILECVAEGDDGTLTAFFGYENRHGEPVTIPLGARNRLTPASFDGQQPTAFLMPNAVPGRPGRTPWYPGHAYTVSFAPGEQVVWRLGSRTSTASDNPAQRCAE